MDPKANFSINELVLLIIKEQWDLHFQLFNFEYS